MKWLEASVKVNSETAEAVAEVLARFVPQGVAIEAGPKGVDSGPVTVRAYLLADEHLPKVRRQVEESIGHLSQILPIPEPTFRPVDETDWSQAWKEQLRVLHIGQRIVIRPSWLPYQAQGKEIVIELDPGMAFGTGLHPTTQMCLMALEERVQPGMQLLDLGTGSGILAIAAAKLGAASVLALDTDTQAVTIARRNGQRNGVANRIKVAKGSLDQATGSFDLVLVNILAKVIIALAEQGLEKRLSPNGVLVTAGLIDDQEEAVVKALGQRGLIPVGRQQIEDWVALEFRSELKRSPD